jgi:hypothetical protein
MQACGRKASKCQGLAWGTVEIKHAPTLRYLLKIQRASIPMREMNLKTRPAQRSKVGCDGIDKILRCQKSLLKQ